MLDVTCCLIITCWRSVVDKLSNKSLLAHIYFDSNTQKINHRKDSFRFYKDSAILNKMFKFPINLILTETQFYVPFTIGHVAQSVTCLTADACQTANQEVSSSISVWSHTFMEIDNEIISTVILLTSAESRKKGCCQLQAKE